MGLYCMTISSRDNMVLMEEIIEKIHSALEEDENRAWSEFSLNSAMRGMEDEESLYSLTDLKETFS